MKATEIKIGLIHEGEYKGWYYVGAMLTNGDMQIIDACLTYYRALQQAMYEIKKGNIILV